MDNAGLALFSTGSAWSGVEPDKSGPANITDCAFARNFATDGGAVDAGYDIIQDCRFEANFAGAGKSKAKTRQNFTVAHVANEAITCVPVAVFTLNRLKVATTPNRAPSYTAVGSGGAYLHSGVAVDLERCTFVGNKAGGEGLAVLSLGIAENISDVVFESNTIHCASGTYAYEMAASDSAVRSAPAGT